MTPRQHRPDPDDATTSPLWPLVTILGEIAVRVNAQRDDGRANQTPETRMATEYRGERRREGGQ